MRGAHVIALGAAALLAACSEQPTGVVSGYAEGEYVYVAAPEGGWVTSVPVKRGMRARVRALDVDGKPFEIETPWFSELLREIRQPKGARVEIKHGHEKVPSIPPH